MTLMTQGWFANASKVISMNIKHEHISVTTVRKKWFWFIWYNEKVYNMGYRLNVTWVDDNSNTYTTSWTSESCDQMKNVFDELVRQIRAQDPHFMDELFEKAIKES